MGKELIFFVFYKMVFFFIIIVNLELFYWYKILFLGGIKVKNDLKVEICL